MITNHMQWQETENGKGTLHPEYWGNVGHASFKNMTMNEAMEIVKVFPPRTAIKRRIQ